MTTGDSSAPDGDIAGTGRETHAAMSRTAIQDGVNLGSTRVNESQASGDQAPPALFQEHSGEARQGALRAQSARQVGEANKRRATAQARKGRGRALKELAEANLRRLTDRLAEARRRIEERRAALATAREAHRLQPRLHRGYFERYLPVALVCLGVVLFDSGVLHGALSTAGLDPVSLWITTLTVPCAIGAANHGFGVLGGAIALRVPPERRLAVAAAWAIAGFGSLVVAFALLTFFRSQAAHAQNEALAGLAAGDAGESLSFFISPVWLGPLQVAGSFAAVTMTALWTAAKPSREHLADVVRPAEAELAAAEAELAGLEAEAEAARAEMADATVVEFDVEAEAAAADVEIGVLRQELDARLAEEEANSRAMKARYETTRLHVDQLYRNGGIWRMAMATVFPRFRRPYTPGPTDVPADEDEIAERHAAKGPRPRRGRLRGRRTAPVSPNGHKPDEPIDPHRF